MALEGIPPTRSRMGVELRVAAGFGPGVRVAAGPNHVARPARIPVDHLAWRIPFDRRRSPRAVASNPLSRPDISRPVPPNPASPAQAIPSVTSHEGTDDTL